MMQRKFKVVEPKKDVNIAKWVAMSSDSQNASRRGSPRVTLSSRTVEQFVVKSPKNDPNLEANATPKSVKILRSPVFFQDDPPKTRSSKRKPKANKVATVQDSTINLDSQNVTPKVIFSPGIIRDTKAWRDNPTKCSGITYRSVTSGSVTDRLDSSRILFKAEVRQNTNNVNNWVTVVGDSNTVLEDSFRIPATFSARTEDEYLQTEKMSEAVLQPRKQSNMSDKVGENKKEIEKLKIELETLINTNLKHNVISQHHLDTNIENVPTNINFNHLSSAVKHNVIISPSKTTKSPLSVRRKSLTVVSDTQDEPKSKAKTYDPESTREFIRKQKLRRKEKLQQEELKKKESEELKKQKLDELKQKTLQLLTENVKKTSSKKVCAKASEEKLASKSSAQLVNNKSSKNLPEKRIIRPRSFDRATVKNSKVNFQENVNKTKKSPCRRSRSVSREPKFCDKKSAFKTRTSMPESIPNSTNTNSNPEIELEQVVNQISNLLNNKIDKNKDEDIAARKIQAAFRAYQQRKKVIKSVEIIPIQLKSIIPQNINNIVSKSNVANEVNPNIIPEGFAQNAPLPKYEINIPSFESHVLVKSVEPLNVRNVEKISKSTSDDIIKITINPHSQKQNEITKINGVTHNKEDLTKTDAVKEIETIKQKLETSICQSNLENKRNETPDWLLPASTLPYPYNFISAVRKKLEIVTKSQSNVDKESKLQSPTTEIFTKDTSIQTLDDKRQSNVSIQCSIEYGREIKESSKPKVVPPKPEELKTFISHKCRKKLFYNSPPKLKSPTNLIDIGQEIVTRNEKKETHSVKSKSKTTITSEASDSDTTKNIPEISEEEQFSKQYSIISDVSEKVKNITFDRPKQLITYNNNGKSFTFDKIKVDNISSKKESKKVSIKSENSDRLQNIIFDRRTNNTSSDINNLIKPDYKMDTSKISRRSSEHKSNRSKYPSDIESILSQYSKIKSSSLHNDSHISQYSEDFNSSTTNHLSLPKSNNLQIQQEKVSSLDIQSDTETRGIFSKAKSSDLSAIKSEILASLARQHSSTKSKILESLSKNSEITTRNSDINIESLNNISNGSHITTKKTIKNTSETQTELTSKNIEINTKNSTNNGEKSLSNTSSKVTEIKSRNSNNSIKEFSNKYLPQFNSNVSEIKLINSSDNNLSNLGKNSSLINSDSMDIDTKNSVIIEYQEKPSKNNKSDISDLKSKNSYVTSNISQIKTNPSNISHFKNEESTVASSIPENSVALKTASQSAQESNIIKSSIHDPSKKETASVKTDSTIQSSSDKFENSDSKSVLKSSNFQNLSKPTVNLKIEKERFFRETKNNPNQIHLKFQAEVHLLNSFNNSLQQVVAVEKSLLDINDVLPATTVNFTRGCGSPDHMESLSVLEPSVCSQDFQMSRLSNTAASETPVATDRSALSATCNSMGNHRESAINKNPFVGVSIGMFDQMIRDEDNRLEHLKTILKLRDKALLDRTKGEIAWLEIQKKQLRENGQLNDVTIIKKKQRGLIIKLEQERHEMQRLKQAHKQAAKERKNALREQKNIIKQQLSSTDQIPTKIRRLSHLERRQSGPVKVYRVESRTEHVRETKMSRNNSGTDETVSVTTSSVVTEISEKVSPDHSGQSAASMALKALPESSVSSKEKAKISDKHSEKVKRALFMKEADLEKRRKEAEELLKWHERLKQEEAQVVELERQAKSIQLDDHEKKRVLTGAQLNKIWKGITGSAEKKFDDHKKYQMSKRSLDKFYQNARKIFKEISEERNSSKRGSEESYTSDFDPSHSPSKVNLSSSIMTQINDTDLSFSPNKMLSERLRKISESSRLGFITSSKTDLNISEHTTVSEKSADKMTVVSEILSVDYQNEIDSSIRTVKDSVTHPAEEKSSSKSSVISESNVISDYESFSNKQAIPTEVESRISNTDSNISELQINSDHEKNKLSDMKESIQSIAENVRNSSTDSDLPELQVVSEHEQPSEEIKLSVDKESVHIIETISKNYSTDLDISDFEIASEYDINSEHIKSTDAIDYVQSISEKYSKLSNNSNSQIKYKNNKNSEQIISNKILESIHSVEENKTGIISELTQLQNTSLQESLKSETDITSKVSKFENEFDDNKSLMLGGESIQADSKTEEHISIKSEENIHIQSLIPEENKNTSIKEIYTSVSDQQISSENLPKTIEENTSKIIDDNIFLVSEIDETNRNIISAEEVILQNSSCDDSATVKSSYVQESTTIQSDKFEGEKLIDNEKNSIEPTNEISSAQNKLSPDSNISEPTSKHSLLSEQLDLHSDINSTILSDNLSSKLIQSKSLIRSKSDTIQSFKIEPEIIEQTANESNTESSTIISSEIKLSLHEELSISGKSDNSLLKTQDKNVISVSNKDLVDSETNSKLDEFEVIKTSLVTESNENKLKNIELNVPSIKDTNISSETIVESKSKNEFAKSLNRDIGKKLNPELFIISDPKIKESEIGDINTISEISAPYESEPYYETDFEKTYNSDFTAETAQQIKESSEELDDDIENDLTVSEAIENIETIKSSVTTETDRKSVTKIESLKSDDERNSVRKDNSETFESEKQSVTIIESPKSNQISIIENEISDLKSEVSVSISSESPVITNFSRKSLSTEAEESIEDIKDISEHSTELQNEDTNVAGVSHIDVRKRVSEILADTTVSRGDKSPRLQDLYVTTYDVLTNSPETTPETGSPTNEYNKRDKSSFTIEAPYRSEAEELLRKQLEIEQEIKQLERQQQQQNIPYLFMREIPNKPPPPYKPPTASVTPVINSVIPIQADQIRKYVYQSADVLFQAYVSGNIEKTSYKSNEDEKVNSQKFVFDLCKEIALEVCNPIKNTRIPSWKTEKNKFQTLISKRPVNKEGLCSVMNKKVLQLLNFEPVIRKDNLIIRWSRKKRDHVDEILVLESQSEEMEWTNYDSDEQTIKDNLTSDIMDMLILETAQVMCEILKKNKHMSWTNYC